MIDLLVAMINNLHCQSQMVPRSMITRLIVFWILFAVVVAQVSVENCSDGDGCICFDAPQTSSFILFFSV